jgi:hypothetical protein
MSTDRPMRDCPRWDTCSVPLCPLDADWRKRAVVSGEAVCPYLRELGKAGDALARFEGRYDQFVVAAAARLHDGLRQEAHPRYVDVLRRIEESAATPTMIEQEAGRAARLAKARRNRADSADTTPACGEGTGAAGSAGGADALA